jgi:signal transduction histidine kinase
VKEVQPHVLRILVVDDEQPLLKFFQQVLCPGRNLQGSESNIEALGARPFTESSTRPSTTSFDIVACHQGDDAVEAVKIAVEENNPFALAFIDMHLPPGPDGVWTAQHIRALDPYIEIVMATAHSNREPAEIALHVPPKEKLFYFKKPLNSREIRQFASALGTKWKAELLLRKAHDKLEQRVKERTAELVRTTKQLRRELAERKRAEEEKTKLESQLRRAEKMELVGTLAGGVAHDLNNILAGLVSYPDLLLMDLPEDSPIRNGILKIQKSGKKVAAIVQDLLTLARRGVTATEVASLNDIITNYLKSPEYEKLKTFHPDAQVESSLETSLLNITGSSIHLSKTVMNLVSNAVEALPAGGKVTISTKNQYIDKPIKGYDHVKEGEYVVLSVTDDGVGIASEDMERLFEPFYTKKVMGRSGTGLGMAVVWGTVKDHKGYIDVQSSEGQGATFDLYFPVTRMETQKDESPPSTEKYMGKGERILVVDDVEEPREIASILLTELGYSVSSVASGEEAVEYVKTNPADLLILDMIMDPGIDGLETYKRILELHPGTKAIIVSGFSETDRVKEAKRLGAGQYLRKPYTLEQIELAVRSELSY